MAEELRVYLHEAEIGTVTRGDGPTRVRLEPSADLESLPVTLSEGFTVIAGLQPSSPDVSNFMGGYAPEGNQRRALAAERDISTNDLFALLREFGGSIAGALNFRLPNEPETHKPRYEPVDNRQIAASLKQAIEKHDLGVHDDSRSMIPGFQPKLLLARFDGQWFEPRGRAHSTHIVKPQLSNRPHAIFHEHYSHQLALHMGLASYRTELIEYGQTTALAIERFDRRVVGFGQVELVHQEDLAQAAGLDWVDDQVKFQDPDRARDPTHASVEKLSTVLGSLPDLAPLETWLRQLTFTVLVGNNDAHAKNFALLHMEGGTALADVYDAVPNLWQADRIKYDLALAIDGQFDIREMSVDRLSSEARSWGVLSGKRIDTAIGETIDAFGRALADVKMPVGCEAEMFDNLVWRHQRLADGKQIGKFKRTALAAAPRATAAAPAKSTRAQPRAPRGTRAGGRYATKVRPEGKPFA